MVSYDFLFHDRAKRIWDKEIVKFNKSKISNNKKEVTGASETNNGSSGKAAKKTKVKTEDAQTDNLARKRPLFSDSIQVVAKKGILVGVASNMKDEADLGIVDTGTLSLKPSKRKSGSTTLASSAAVVERGGAVASDVFAAVHVSSADQSIFFTTILVSLHSKLTVRALDQRSLVIALFTNLNNPYLYFY